MFNKILCETHENVANSQKRKNLIIKDYVNGIENLLNHRSSLKLEEFQYFFTHNRHIPPQYIGMPSNIDTYLGNLEGLSVFFDKLLKTIDPNISESKIVKTLNENGNIKILIMAKIFSSFHKIYLTL